MDERQLDQLSAVMSALSGIAGLSERTRSRIEDIVGAGMEGATEGANGAVSMSREHFLKKTHEIVESLSNLDILLWVSNDPRAERMIEEYVREDKGWDGHNLIPLLRRCMEYEYMRIVYAALVSVKTVTIQ